MGDENIFFSQGNIYISNSRISIGGTTYSTANITSVSIKKTPAKAGCAISLLVIGGIGIITGFSALGNNREMAYSSFLVWGVVIAAGLFWLSRQKPTFHVLLASASGENEALSSKNEELIGQVTDAVNNAIVARG